MRNKNVLFNCKHIHFSMEEGYENHEMRTVFLDIIESYQQLKAVLFGDRMS